MSSLAPGIADLLERVEFFRLDAGRKADAKTRTQLGQFMTPPGLAAMLASMFKAKGDTLRLLDPGAGVGSLTAAFVAEVCSRKHKPHVIEATAFEVYGPIVEYLNETFELCRVHCEAAGIEFIGHVHQEDFIEEAVQTLADKGSGLFGSDPTTYTSVIMNPPYRKIGTASKERTDLRRVGIETTNLYPAFMALACRLMAPDGELVSITPRSFANGPYFKPFRRELLDTMRLRRLHVFESRSQAFKGDEVLQENIIVHAVKTSRAPSSVVITCNAGPDDDAPTVHRVNYNEVVRPDDPDRFIHLLTDGVDQATARRMGSFTATLKDLGLQVSTGRVVDFRAKSKLRDKPGNRTVPLIYPGHFSDGLVKWPKLDLRKPNALVDDVDTKSLQVPRGVYVLVKRFSAKEEKRRVVAAVYDPNRIDAEAVGFENHLNYFHASGAGIPMVLAKGLATFLNSTLADMFFRQFNGHTQVNATDLRSFRFPTRDQLETIGHQIGDQMPNQAEVDRLIEGEIVMAEGTEDMDPVKAKQKVGEARAILKAIGMPRAQQNERSALTLLALLDLKPATPWSEAKPSRLGITPMMDFFSTHYGKTYAPNSRETVRRQTVHQFRDAGLIIQNPDDPTRPTNSGLNVYEVEPTALKLLRQYKSDRWDKALDEYLENQKTLREQYAQERKMSLIPVTLPDESKLSLSPGGQNVLVKEIIEEFCPRFTPGGHVLVCGDTADKWLHCDRDALQNLGVAVDEHGKFPDVVVYYPDKNWLVLIEAVTSHGPVDPKRRRELEELFEGCTAGLVYVTTFLTRKAMVNYLDQISWETEVWVADSPSHMIHFNGVRFLGPYEQSSV